MSAAEIGFGIQKPGIRGAPVFYETGDLKNIERPVCPDRIRHAGYQMA